MRLNDIALLRLISQQIAGTKFSTPKEIVQWMGAMQAQDFAMAKWAIGLRLPGSTCKTIEESLNKGEILRTHLLRPTWHFVSAADIRWMLELTAPQIKSSLKSRHKELELTEPVIRKSNATLRKALSDNIHLEREVLMLELTKAKIPTDNNRLSHLLMMAELDGLICSGPSAGKKRTYALLDRFVPKSKAWTREEALAKLADRYFSSHYPATLQDFAWWSGLSVTDARRGLEMNKPSFISETIHSQTYWFPSSFAIPETDNHSVYLLPAFDEFIISYKNRNAALNEEHKEKSISSNGIFRPVIVINGQVTGLWKQTLNKGKVLTETSFFRIHNKTELSSIATTFEKLSHFLEIKPV